MFSKITESSGAKFALTSTEYNHLKKLAGIKDAFTKFKKQVDGWPEQLTWIITDDQKTPNKTPLSPGQSKSLNFKDDDLAFLQYTSGSTSEPKGVMITHGNLAHNLTIITNELKAKDDTVVVSWLPQYHDMGLIGSYLGVIYCGGCGYYISPLSFLQRPCLWIEAVSKYQATHLQAPNFAFKLTARKFNPNEYKKNPLKLSSVRHIINAAEPVDEDSMNSFYSKFQPFGLQRVIYPTYGLAEHTVFVCSGGKQVLTVKKHELEVDGEVILSSAVSASKDGESSSTTSTLVGCGFPSRQGVDVRIVDRETCHELPVDKVGEIWIQSPSKAGGYFLKGPETKEDFHATLDDGGGIEYLRTGDLGFIHDDELFICGRLKDLIIGKFKRFRFNNTFESLSLETINSNLNRIRLPITLLMNYMYITIDCRLKSVAGRNYYPQDLEATAEASSDNLRPGCSAAFTVDPTHVGGEEVAIVMELREVPKNNEAEEKCAALANGIRAALNQEHSLGVSEVLLLKPKTVPKTTSGKIARAWCRKGYLDGTLEVVYRKSFKDSTASFEIDGSSTNMSRGGAISRQKIDELRSQSKQEISEKLINDVSRVGSVPVDSLDSNTALVTILDSLSISQFKGLLETGYAVKISDEYLFRESTTINKLVEVVKLGYAPDDVEGEGVDAGNGASQGVSMATTQQAGTAGGIAGALGCPPGVVCCSIQ